MGFDIFKVYGNLATQMTNQQASKQKSFQNEYTANCQSNIKKIHRNQQNPPKKQKTSEQVKPLLKNHIEHFSHEYTVFTIDFSILQKLA